MQRHAGGLLSFVVYLVLCVCGGGGLLRCGVTLDVWSYAWPQLEVSQQKKVKITSQSFHLIHGY